MSSILGLLMLQCAHLVFGLVFFIEQVPLDVSSLMLLLEGAHTGVQYLFASGFSLRHPLVQVQLLVLLRELIDEHRVLHSLVLLHGSLLHVVELDLLSGLGDF